MSSFASRQTGLIGLTILFLLFAMANSFFLGPFLLPLMYPYFPYLNAAILTAIILFGSVGLATLYRRNDRGWPLFLALVGVWVFVMAFEDSMLQWFVFQLGGITEGGRVDALLITASAAAVGCAVLLHANMLARRMRAGFVERGIEPKELSEVEAHAFAEARTIVLRLVLLVGVAAGVLFVMQFALLGVSLGLGVLGILAGLVIVTLISVLAFQTLRKGPVPAIHDDAPRARGPRRPPPGGLR